MLLLLIWGDKNFDLCKVGVGAPAAETEIPVSLQFIWLVVHLFTCLHFLIGIISNKLWEQSLADFTLILAVVQLV